MLVQSNRWLRSKAVNRAKSCILPLRSRRAQGQFFTFAFNLLPDKTLGNDRAEAVFPSSVTALQPLAFQPFYQTSAATEISNHFSNPHTNFSK